MTEKVWESVGGRVGDVSARAALGVAGPYWLCAALVYGAWRGYENAFGDVVRLGQATQIVGLIVAAALIAATAAIIETLVFPVTRFLEGYGRLWPFRRYAAAAQWRRRTRLDERWGVLKRVAAPNAEQTAELVRTDTRLRHFPEKPGDVMPTALGNILRASERRPLVRYGLDPIPVWPQLWLVMADGVRREVVAARRSLDAAVRAFIWALLFLPWAILIAAAGSAVPDRARWAVALAIVAISIGVAWASYLRACQAATAYATMVEAAFDVSRSALYRALRLPLPRSPAEERALGRAVTGFLYNGFTEGLPQYVDSPSDGSAR